MIDEICDYFESKTKNQFLVKKTVKMYLKEKQQLYAKHYGLLSATIGDIHTAIKKINNRERRMKLIHSLLLHAKLY